MSEPIELAPTVEYYEELRITPTGMFVIDRGRRVSLQPVWTDIKKEK